MSSKIRWVLAAGMAMLTLMGALTVHTVLGASPVAAPKYYAPVAVAASADGSRLFVAEDTACRVAVVDARQGAVVRSIPMPGPVSGVALSPDGALLYATIAAAQGMVCLLDTRTGKLKSPPIAVGHTPMNPVLSPDGHTLYVCNRFTNDISVIDVKANQETDCIPVLREPVAAALTPDGKWLFVANLLPVGYATADSASAAVTVIDTTARTATAQIALPDGATGVRGLCLSPDGKYAYVTHTLARYKMPTTQLDHGWMNTNALSVIDVAKQQLLGTVLLDNLDLGAANPWGVACSPDGTSLCVTHAGTHELSIIDRAAFHRKLANALHPEDDLTFLLGMRTRITLPGLGPRGLCIANGTAYVAQYYSGDLAAVTLPPRDGIAPRTIALGPAQPLTLDRKGEIVFNDGTRCFQQWQSCATCHPDARVDGLNWDLLNDGLGKLKNTRSMLLSYQTPPVMITGIRPNAETAVRAGMKFILFQAGTEDDAVAMDNYLKHLSPVPSPFLVNGKLSPSAERGRQVFTQAGCAYCHPAPLYTDLKFHDVGTGRNEELGRKFVTPTLVEVWRTAPYLYDGHAATMREVLVQNAGDRHGHTRQLSAQQLDDLDSFVRSL